MKVPWRVLTLCAILSLTKWSASHGQAPARREPAGPDCTPSTDTSATLRGWVLDDSTSKPIPFAFVKFADLGRGVRADSNGRFDFGAVSAGTYRVEVSARYDLETRTGYGQSLLDTMSIRWGQVCEVTFRMRKAPLLMSH